MTQRFPAVYAPEYEEILSKPTCSVEEYAKVSGIGRTLAYEQIRRGEIPHIRNGRAYRVLTAPLRQMLEGDPVASV